MTHPAVGQRKERKVLVFSNAHEYTVRHRVPLLEHLSSLGWSVEGVAPQGSPASDAFRSLGIAVSTVPLTRAGTHPFAELRAMRSIERVYRRIRPTVAIHATIKPVLYGTRAARRWGVPVVNLITGLGFAYSSNGTRARLVRAVASRMYRTAFAYPQQRVVFQNEDDRRELAARSGLPAERSRVIPGSGVDVNHFRPDPRNAEKEGAPPLVVLPGRLLFDKGAAHFVEAASILQARFPDARFALIGPTDEENPAGVGRDVLDRWLESGNIEWWGSIPDIREAYRQASIVVLPSRREGMPKVVLEAAASALPVVTTDVPGCRDSVLDGETGFLVPFGDSAALADRIATLLGSRSLRLEMGRKARLLAEDRFAARIIVEQITTTLMELV